MARPRAQAYAPYKDAGRRLASQPPKGAVLTQNGYDPTQNGMLEMAEAAFSGIASCATRCACCEMHKRIAVKAESQIKSYLDSLRTEK